MSVSGNEDIFTTWLSEIGGDDTAVVYLCGELDASTAPGFLADMQQVMGRRQHVVLDAHLLSYVDSAGVAAMLSVKRALAEHGKDLCMAGCHGLLAKILHITRIDAEVRCFEDPDSAMTWLRNPG